MNVHVNEMNSTIHATDSGALLSPELLRQITQAVLAALREQQAYEQRRMDERQIRSSSSGQSHTWESARD
jgi:hypothetical protein